ncbi:MAG: hypothetical protein CMK09_10085 [Ponticaulis sp.]|nr:hypothetical protein [Ponticaulis sp.]|tara:strand:- start:32504 stop:33505 length:1002 start_codon:yes stop_codon:yes gene_type:complete
MNDSGASKSGCFSLPFIMFGVVGLVAALYSAYWVWMSGEIRKGAVDWVEAQRNWGSTVEYSDLSVSGYPFRFVLQADDPVMQNVLPQTRWEGETLQLIAQSWNLNHILIRIPGENDVRLPDRQEVTFYPGDKTIGSLVFKDGRLKRLGLEAPELNGEFGTGEAFELAGLSLGLAPMPDTATDLKLALSLDELSLPSAVDGAEWLGDQLDHLVVWIEVENFYPLVEGELTETEWKVDRNQIHLRRGELEMGPLKAASQASVTLDRDNNPDGTVGVHLLEPETLKSALEAEGVMTRDIETVINTLKAINSNGAFATVKVKDRKFSLPIIGTIGEY